MAFPLWTCGSGRGPGQVYLFGPREGLVSWGPDQHSPGSALTPSALPFQGSGEQISGEITCTPYPSTYQVRSGPTDLAEPNAGTFTQLFCWKPSQHDPFPLPIPSDPPSAFLLPQPGLQHD